LHISKQLAERLGGTITVRSTLGEGSCFEATVRTGSIEPSQLVYSEEELPDAQLSSFNSQPSDTGAQGYLSSKVLLAEDNPDNQRLIALYMRKIGVSVTTVDNGKQALERALDSGFDLILMDVQMPEMNGLEATERLRKAGYTGPIVALTANALKEDRDRCHAAGCNDFLSKPIEKVSFYALVGKYLSRATSNRESEEEGEQELNSLLLSHHRA
jgi:CheY-like chemotaxis protein